MVDSGELIVAFGKRNRLSHFVVEVEGLMKQYPQNMKDILEQLSDGVTSDKIIDTLYNEYDEVYQKSKDKND